MLRPIVELVAWREGDDVRVTVAPSTLSNLDADVVHPERTVIQC